MNRKDNLKVKVGATEGWLFGYAFIIIDHALFKEGDWTFKVKKFEQKLGQQSMDNKAWTIEK